MKNKNLLKQKRKTQNKSKKNRQKEMSQKYVFEMNNKLFFIHTKKNILVFCNHDGMFTLGETIHLQVGVANINFTQVFECEKWNCRKRKHIWD